MLSNFKLDLLAATTDHYLTTFIKFRLWESASKGLIQITNLDNNSRWSDPYFWTFDVMLAFLREPGQLDLFAMRIRHLLDFMTSPTLPGARCNIS